MCVHSPVDRLQHSDDGQDLSLMGIVRWRDPFAEFVQAGNGRPAHRGQDVFVLSVALTPLDGGR